MTSAMAMAAENFDRRIVERVGEDRVFERDHVLPVDGFEILVGALFAIEELHHAHAADMFLRKGVDARDGGTHAAIGLAHMFAEHARDEQDEGQHGEGDQRQPPVHPQHDEDNSGEHEDILKDGKDAGGEHLVERVHVAGEPRDQASHGIRVEETDVHALHVAEDLAAQVEHDLLPGPLHQVGLHKFQQNANTSEAR